MRAAIIDSSGVCLNTIEVETLDIAKELVSAGAFSNIQNPSAIEIPDEFGIGSIFNGSWSLPEEGKDPEPESSDILVALLGPEPTAKAAEQTRRAVQLFAMSLPKEQALEIASVFPSWETSRQYYTGDIISYGTNSTGDPQLYKVVQDHISSEEWTPDSVPSLYDAMGLDEEGYPVWSKPSGAHDAYNKGDIVNYNGTLYRSLVDGNTWSPDEYAAAWELFEEG